jgi:hypothetical protein
MAVTSVATALFLMAIREPLILIALFASMCLGASLYLARWQSRWRNTKVDLDDLGVLKEAMRELHTAGCEVPPLPRTADELVNKDLVTWCRLADALFKDNRERLIQAKRKSAIEGVEAAAARR